MPWREVDRLIRTPALDPVLLVGFVGERGTRIRACSCFQPLDRRRRTRAAGGAIYNFSCNSDEKVRVCVWSHSSHRDRASFSLSVKEKTIATGGSERSVATDVPLVPGDGRVDGGHLRCTAHTAKRPQTRAIQATADTPEGPCICSCRTNPLPAPLCKDRAKMHSFVDDADGSTILRTRSCASRPIQIYSSWLDLSVCRRPSHRGPCARPCTNESSACACCSCCARALGAAQESCDSGPRLLLQQFIAAWSNVMTRLRYCAFRRLAARNTTMCERLLCVHLPGTLARTQPVAREGIKIGACQSQSWRATRRPAPLAGGCKPRRWNATAERAALPEEDGAPYFTGSDQADAAARAAIQAVRKGESLVQAGDAVVGGGSDDDGDGDDPDDEPYPTPGSDAMRRVRCDRQSLLPLRRMWCPRRL